MILLGVMLLLLAGCKDKELWLQDKVRYLEKQDVEYYLTHGTNVTIFCKSGQEGIEEVVDLAKSYGGLIVYYYPLENISQDIKDDLGVFGTDELQIS